MSAALTGSAVMLGLALALVLTRIVPARPRGDAVAADRKDSHL